jgi:uncharacterized repeat protein (TIGR03803 family)
MASSRILFLLKVFAILFWELAFIAPATASGSTETALYSFDGVDGGYPYGGVVFDASGNLYGTTYQGGAYGYGAVFELSPSGSGQWTETVIHSFNFDVDGVLPCAGLIFDGAGNLYGTTHGGGMYGYGIVFQLTPAGDGNWNETVLHNFDETDGSDPYSPLIFDSSGNLYGTTAYGGASRGGVVFQLSEDQNGCWNESVLHSFSGSGSDGAYPFSPLVLDATGNVYGTTSVGGGDNLGTVFELTPQAGGNWSEAILYSFSGGDGANPYGGLVSADGGKLYGTTSAGGKYTYGTIFQLTPLESGGWQEKVLYSFNKNEDGAAPYSGLTAGPGKIFYGTAFAGGTHGFGTVFELGASPCGKWWFRVLTNFDLPDGDGPNAGVALKPDGNLYGMTEYGGESGCPGLGCGVVFAITP